MALLNQRENEYALFTGWYGDCENSCNAFDLTSHLNEIYAVYQFTEDAKGVKSFLSSAPSMFHDFEELSCGKMYWIVLNPGTNALDIPNFTQSYYSDDDKNLGYIETCEDADSRVEESYIELEVRIPAPTTNYPFTKSRINFFAGSGSWGNSWDYKPSDWNVDWGDGQINTEHTHEYTNDTDTDYYVKIKITGTLERFNLTHTSHIWQHEDFSQGYNHSTLGPEIEKYKIVGMSSITNAINIAYKLHFIKENDLDFSKWDTSNLETELKFMDVGKRVDEDKRPNLTLKNLGQPVHFNGGAFNEIHLEMTHSGANLFHGGYKTKVKNLKIVDKTGLLSSGEELRGFSVTDTLDLSEMNTENWTSMYRLFSYFKGRHILGLENFNTSNVTNMQYMFHECKATSLDLSSFDTSNVTRMDNMFSNCKATSIDLSNFNTSNVTDMWGMFSGCKATSIDLSSFDTSNVTIMENMFRDCQVTSLDLSSFDTSKVYNFSQMFDGVSKITSLDLSSFTFDKANKLEFMFLGMTNLTQLNIDLDTTTSSSSAINARGMFSGCKKLQSIDVSKMRKVTYAESMFEDCESLTSIVGISEWDVENFGENDFGFGATLLESFDNMFHNCKSLTNLDLSNWCVWDFPEEQPWESPEGDGNGRGKAPLNFATNAPFYENEANRPKWGEYTANCTEPTPTPTPSPTPHFGEKMTITIENVTHTDVDLKLVIPPDLWERPNASIRHFLLTIGEIDHGIETGYFETIRRWDYIIGPAFGQKCNYSLPNSIDHGRVINANKIDDDILTVKLSECNPRFEEDGCANTVFDQLEKNTTYYARFHIMSDHLNRNASGMTGFGVTTVAVSFQIPEEPTPTPTPISSAGCCPDSTIVVKTDGTPNMNSAYGIVNDVSKSLFSFQGFDQNGRLCVDSSNQNSSSIDDFATTKMVYLNDTTGSPIGTIKKFLKNNQNTIYYTDNSGNCYTGEIGDDTNIILTQTVFAFPDETPTPTPLVSITPTPMDNFAPDFNDDFAEPYPKKDGCLDYENNVGIANDQYYLDGNEDHTGTYNMGIGTYLLKDVPTNHPIFLENNDESKITIESKTSEPISGVFGTGYVGDVVINVKGDFGLISYKCANHGYMGGENNLMYNAECDQTKSNFMVMSEDLKSLPMNLREEHTFEGLVEYIDLEGGFYGIVVYDKQSNELSNYLPLNLQKELKNKQGQKIKIVNSYSNTDMMSIFMWGKLINVQDYHFVISSAGCHRDIRPCGNEGEFVVRDPALNCNFPPCFFDLEKFEETFKAWKEMEIKNYAFDFAWDCYCDEQTRKLVNILVVDNKIESISDSDGNVVGVDDSFGYYSMTDLFDYVHKEFKKYPHSMIVEYEENYIKSWFVDRDKMIADEELGFSVSNFIVLTDEEAQSEKEYYESDRRR